MPHCISHPTPDSDTPLHDECTVVITGAGNYMYQGINGFIWTTCHFNSVAYMRHGHNAVLRTRDIR